MRPSLVMFTVVTILGAAASAAPHPLAGAASSSAAATPRGGEAIRQYGHIKALTRRGARFELRFDPAWWLTGTAAERAAVEDKAIQPGEPVPNDYYIVDEGHRLLTYPVPATARVTILTRASAATAITVSELAQIVMGKNPKHRRLLEPKAGFWIRIGARYPGAVLSLDQQYQP